MARSVARGARPHLYVLNTQGLDKSFTDAALRSYSKLNVIIVCTYQSWSITAVPSRAKSKHLSAHVDPGSPPSAPALSWPGCPSADILPVSVALQHQAVRAYQAGGGGGAGYCPRVRHTYSLRRLSP